MGNKICVCDGDIHNEKESNIFSILPKKNNFKKDELKTLTLENKITQGSVYKSFLDDNNSFANKLDNFLSEMSKSKNNSQKIEGQKVIETIKEDNNFHCSGKFKFPENKVNNKIPNGKYNNENDSVNIKENKEANNNGSNNLKKDELGFVSFKSLIVDNSHNIEMKENKDNNMTISNNFDKNKETDGNKIIEEVNIIKKKNKFENGSPLFERNQNYGQLRYNEISKYSDVSDEDYLNYESNYTNSNQREENRDEQSLFDEIENDNP